MLTGVGAGPPPVLDLSRRNSASFFLVCEDKSLHFLHISASDLDRDTVHSVQVVKTLTLIVFNASEFRFSPFLEIILMTQWVNIKGQGYIIQFL